MSRPPSMERDELIRRLTEVFREVGYEDASLARLAERAGIAKAALYHHFPDGKAAIAGAVLESVGKWMTREVFTPLHGPGTPRERIQIMARALDVFYAGGATACLLALFSLGEARSLFQEHVAGGTEAWISALATAIRDAGFTQAVARRRAEEAIMHIQGALVMTRATKNKAYFTRLIRSLPDELLATN